MDTFFESEKEKEHIYTLLVFFFTSAHVCLCDNINDYMEIWFTKKADINKKSFLIAFMFPAVL